MARGTTPEPFGLTPHESQLWQTCLSSLERFRLHDDGILARRAVWDGRTLSPLAEPSPRNTAEVAKALHRVRRAGFAVPLDPDALVERIVVEYLSLLEYPDVALTLWADSLGNGRHLPALWQALRQRLPSGAPDTMELAWTLSALSHYLPVASDPGEVRSLAHVLWRQIAGTQSQTTGFFHESDRREGWLRRRPARASLSVQAYAVQALALYARVFDVSAALQQAERCAEAFCTLQGPLGQWWWKYHTRTGNVLESYPVYSVNQDSAVPLALGELERVTGRTHRRASVARGIAWLFGENELGTSLVDSEAGTIWRAIERRDGAFTIVREMHSYHPGRCLYALCAKVTPRD